MEARIRLVMVLNNDYELLKRNLLLIKSLNYSLLQSIDFLLVDNSKCIQEGDYNFIQSLDLNIEMIDGYDYDPHHSHPGSNHHGSALNLAVSGAGDYDYLIVTEPDFFLLEEDWIRKYLGIMLEDDFYIYGAAAHPANGNKVKDFPGPRFFIANLKFFPIHELDWTWGSDSIEKSNALKKDYFLNRFARLMPASIQQKIYARFNQQISVDTGIKIHESYFNDFSLTYNEIGLLKCLVRRNEISSSAIKYYANKLFDYLLPKKYNIFHNKSYRLASIDQLDQFSKNFSLYEKYTRNLIDTTLVAFHRRGTVNPDGLCDEANEIIDQAISGILKNI
ncbi:hypothetical protein N9E88_03925 [Gammaproteobacteria bacterium]|nr:hypothetical protein [Gammaproteobacteria bacterium]MDA9175256.1 hypothetical protein [Gammaproteobacteria bacterium]MDA9979393.1 hypothetical protein [Gammaproteobacteria bacterium]